VKTIRRDKLFRLAQAGKLVAVGSYHYDEMTGQDSSKGIRFPVRIQAGHGDFKEGFYNLLAFDFHSKSGCAYLDDDGKTAHLHVHSNSNYDFRMADGSAFSEPCAAWVEAHKRGIEAGARMMDDQINAMSPAEFASFREVHGLAED